MKGDMHPIIKDPWDLKNHILKTLAEKGRPEILFPENGFEKKAIPSSVMFLLGQECGGGRFDPCLVLNKRSQRVRQPGDLCCPGGGVEPCYDFYLSKILSLPLLPSARWPYWRQWRRRWPNRARKLALLLATGLRESYEEMRLNPFHVRFLGGLPPQRLILFYRSIYPMVGWLSPKARFIPNWEVEQIVRIPLRHLLDPSRYASYRVTYVGQEDQRQDDFPCFVHTRDERTEILWGATYRITAAFLDIVFDFRPPPLHNLPVIAGSLRKAYFANPRERALAEQARDEFE